MGMKLICAAVGIIAITAAWGPFGTRVINPPKAGENIQVPAFEWRVRTKEQIAEEYKAAGKVLYEGQEIVGFVGRVNGKLVIYTTRPMVTNDRATCSIGHEIMHEVLGDYHQKMEAH